MTEEVSVKDDIGGNEDTWGPTRTGKTGQPSTRTRRFPQRLLLDDISREEAIRRLEIFDRLTRLISESNYGARRLTTAVARMLAEMMGDMSVITLLNPDNKTYDVAAYHDPDPGVLSLFEQTMEEIGHIPREQGWVAGVIQTGRPLLVPTISVDQANKAAVPSFAEFTRQVGIDGMLIVPITGQSGVLGAIAMTRHRGGHPYDEYDQSCLLEVAHRLGLALENFTLVDSLRKEVGARQLAGEALAASEERFLSIFRSSVFGIKLLDLVGTMLETNAAFQAMSGYDESELIAMHFYDLVHPEDLPLVLAAFNTLKTGREQYGRNEHRLVRKDGSVVWVRTTFAGVKKAGGSAALSLIFGIVENITDAKQTQAELQELQQHLQASIELERLRLAQDIHDAPLQDLYAVIYKLEEVRLKSSDSDSVALLQEAVGEIKKTLDALRSTASELRPPALSRFGLEKAIRSYAEDFKQKHPDIQLKLTLAHDRQFLSEPVRLVLFRAFQESLNNVVKHARATEVQVHFSFDAEEARIEIADNGKGFQVPATWIPSVRRGHYGLAGMAERVSAAGGVLTIESSPDTSTLVRVVIPCAA